jgi:magnesium transporter
VTGFFGQNMEFPGEGQWTGLGLSIAIIAVTSLILHRAFRQRDWI